MTRVTKLFIFIEVRKKFAAAFKLLLALAILVILAVQLAGAIGDAADYYRRWLNRDNPHGSPMKVFGGPGHPAASGENSDFSHPA